ncbi:hypothetical protein L211DRAFT_835383 [Terfezia boudieri ATCC MYA-4762]|uniref:Uncharacterized protein n=1 Tax=Terfezia boudieri ATCC MYA-4762 TaxID=1051890 RepID=A0A3N4LUU2_9PEZI|nr:hypothetical protein L211DRAFT_835383 [Terfezia boudieri ATCC MYA-4762]
MSSPEQPINEHRSHRSHRAWPWTDRSTDPCPPACACRGGSGAVIDIPMAAMLPVRATPSSLVNGLPPAAARSGTMCSAATTAVDPPRYDVHTQFSIIPPMPVYSPLGPGGELKDPSRDPDTWSLATQAVGSRPSTMDVNTNNGALGSSPLVSPKPSNSGKEVAIFVFAYFTTYILPILIILPALVVFYIWACQIAVHPIPGSDFYQKYAWLHTYPAPELTSGGAWSIAAFLYSIIGAAFHHVFFKSWVERMRKGITPLRRGERRAMKNENGSKSRSCNCSSVSFIMLVVLYILMVPVLVSMGFSSVYILLTTPAQRKSQGRSY